LRPYDSRQHDDRLIEIVALFAARGREPGIHEHERLEKEFRFTAPPWRIVDVPGRPGTTVCARIGRMHDRRECG
jgi:hypothetical protein